MGYLVEKLRPLRLLLLLVSEMLQNETTASCFVAALSVVCLLIHVVCLVTTKIYIISFSFWLLKVGLGSVISSSPQVKVETVPADTFLTYLADAQAKDDICILHSGYYDMS